MKCFFDSAVAPSIGWQCNLFLSEALLLILVLITGPWSPAAAASGEATRHCRAGTSEYLLPESCITWTGAVVQGTLESGLEGQDAALVFRVTVDNPRSESITVDWRTEDIGTAGTATAGEDYTPSSGSLSFPSGPHIRTRRSISIPIIDDFEIEPAEELYLRLDLGPVPENHPSDVDNTRYVLFRVPIHSNDVPPRCSGSRPTICSTNDGVTFSIIQTQFDEGTDATADFTVTADNPRSESITAGWETEPFGTATAGEDYTASSGSLTIASGRTSHTISVPIIDDSEFEPPERFFVRLDVGPVPEGQLSDVDFRFGGTISSDDAPPPTEATEYCGLGTTCGTSDGVTFSIRQTKGHEGTDTTLDFTLTVDNPSSESMTVGWRSRMGWAWTNSNHAVPGQDYEASSGSLSIAPGRTSHTISIPIVDDSEAEPAELLALELDIGPAPENHPNDNFLRYFHFRGYIVSNDDNTPPTVTVAHEPVTFLDAPNFSGWPVVRVIIDFNEPVTGFDQSDLEFQNGRIVEFSRTSPQYQQSWRAIILPEEESPSGTMSIRVPAGAVTALSGLANTASNTIEIQVPQTQTRFHNPQRAVLECLGSSDPEVWANPANRDDPWSLGGNSNVDWVEAQAYKVNSVWVYYRFTVPYRSWGSYEGLPTVNPRESMSLTNEAGINAMSHRPSLKRFVYDDFDRCTGGTKICNWRKAIAPGMTGQLTLQMLPGAVVAYRYHLPNRASAPMAVAGWGWSVSVADASAEEGTDGTVEFEVRLDARDDCKAVKVDYATADGTATAGEDYTAASGTLTFEPGEKVKTISIPVLDGGGSDSGETFELRLSNALGVEIQTEKATGTIVNGAAAPLTARFENLSGPNDGSSPFSFELHFSENPNGLSYKTVRDALFDVVGGAVTGARRLTKGSNQGWAVTVQPSRAGEVAIAVRGTESCEDEHAVCTENGDMLAGGERLVVTSSQSLVVRATADAVLEGQDATIEFLVRMSHAVADEVRVRYGADSDSRLDDDASMATPGEDYKAVSGTIVFAPGEMQKTVSAAVLDDELVEGDESVRLAFSDANRPSSTSSRSTGRFANFSATATIMDDESAVESLTASFAKMPDSHNGSGAFEFEIHFNEEPHDLSYKTVRDALFDVANGTVNKARRLTRGSNLAFVVTVEPTAQDTIEISVRGTESCDAEHAVCAADGRMLSAGPSVTVQLADPITLSVADAEVEEGPEATLDFVMSLSRAADDDITVGYRAYDGTATAGADYEAVRSSIVFSPGQTEKTVSVVVLDDAHDEDTETVNFWITSVRGLTVEQVVDPYATGTIRNTDPMPKAWIARFGRTVGGQVVDALAGRLDGSPSSHVTVGGRSVDLGAVGPAGQPTVAMADRLHERSAWSSAWDDRRETRSMSGRDVLLGSSFHLSSGAPDGKGAALTAWGRVATGGFEADVDDVRMDGDVTTGMLGVDAEWDRVLAGVMVSQSDGEGSYVLSEAMGDDRGTVESTLTGVYPYARITMGGRVSAWGLAGIGHGGLTLHQDGQASLKTDLSMTMGAVGVKGAVLDPADENGVGVNVRSDAMWVRTESDRTTGLASAEADVSRLRLILEGERAFDLGDGATLTPTGQVGVRVDGGDAETGAGLELGAGMRYTAGAVSVEGQIRTLVAHEESGFEEWGASGALRVSPDGSGRGLTLSLAPVWGNGSNGPERLWTARDATALAVGDDVDDGGRLDAEVGYGLGIGRVPGVVTPYAGVSFAGGGGRSWRSGARWAIAPGAALGVEATRAEAGGDDTVEHGLMLRGSIRW